MTPRTGFPKSQRTSSRWTERSNTAQAALIGRESEAEKILAVRTLEGGEGAVQTPGKFCERKPTHSL
jgi:hypothetical protein